MVSNRLRSGAQLRARRVQDKGGDLFVFQHRFGGSALPFRQGPPRRLEHFKGTQHTLWIGRAQL
jgi:hypothetical protein